MKTSLVLGRTGSFDEETGLFVLRGRPEYFAISPETVKAIAQSRDGFEVNSTAPFADLRLQTSDRVTFINNCSFYCKTWKDFKSLLPEMLDLFQQHFGVRDFSGLDLAPDFEPLFCQFRMDKIANKRYLTEWAGLAPSNNILKVIVKQQGVATKRTMLFATGIPPSAGGRMWLVSPHGFSWWGDNSKVVVDMGGTIDIDQALAGDKFLFLLVSNAVLLLSGHRKLQQDEQYPRVLCYDKLSERDYQREVEAYVYYIAQDNAVPFVEGVETLNRLYGYTSLNGGSVSKAQDFGVDHALALPEENEMW